MLIRLLWLSLFYYLISSSAFSMTFTQGGTDHRGDDSAWIQADGPIDEDTVERFMEFLQEHSSWFPKRIRFNSPGGNLHQGINLGLKLRSLGFATEVGTDEIDPDWEGVGSSKFTRRLPGSCSSACAYAFMGGVERVVEEDSIIGVHQFSRASKRNSDQTSTPVLIEEGAEQEMSANLIAFILKMGIDARIFVAAGLHAPEEMYWIDGQEAAEIGLAYAPNSWEPWTISTFRKGVIATSERQDKKYRMSAMCTQKSGALFEIFITDEQSEDGQWNLYDWVVDQCLPIGDFDAGEGAHMVLGNKVLLSDTTIVDHQGGFSVRFGLGRNPEISGDPSFLVNVIGACLTDRFLGNKQNMTNAISIAYSNCIR